MRFFTLTQAEPSHIINLRGLAIPNSIELGLTSNSVFFGTEVVQIRRIYNLNNTSNPSGNPSSNLGFSFAKPTAAQITTPVAGLTLDKLWADGWLEFYIEGTVDGTTSINLAVGLPA